MLGMLSSLDRMTMSFRFVSGSSQLDAQSRANVKRFAVVLEGANMMAARLHLSVSVKVLARLHRTSSLLKPALKWCVMPS
jgi:hypothetical protein